MTCQCENLNCPDALLLPGGDLLDLIHCDNRAVVAVKFADLGTFQLCGRCETKCYAAAIFPDAERVREVAK